MSVHPIMLGHLNALDALRKDPDISDVGRQRAEAKYQEVVEACKGDRPSTNQEGQQ